MGGFQAKQTGGLLSQAARNILLIEERYAGGDALFRGITMGLFDCNMMLEPGRTKFLVEENCCFSMRPFEQGSYQKPSTSVFNQRIADFPRFSVSFDEEWPS